MSCFLVYTYNYVVYCTMSLKPSRIFQPSFYGMLNLKFLIMIIIIISWYVSQGLIEEVCAILGLSKVKWCSVCVWQLSSFSARLANGSLRRKSALKTAEDLLGSMWNAVRSNNGIMVRSRWRFVPVLFCSRCVLTTYATLYLLILSFVN